MVYLLLEFINSCFIVLYTSSQVTRNGTGECEAEACVDALNHAYPGLRGMLKDPKRRQLTMGSSTTDNAPNAKLVSTLLEQRKHSIFDDIESVHGRDAEALRDVFRELYKLTCTNHVHVKVGEAWWSVNQDHMRLLVKR